jgi:hypothetical protein
MPQYLIRSDGIDPEQMWDAPDDATAIAWATETLLDSGAEPGEEIVLVRVEDDYRQAEEHVATLTMPGGST